ncbi:MAG: ABC transporter permease [Candidatus Saccharibacteria bacterium]|nr:ABC transporter permease [Candidatus Saccharibacteria bacterium]
MNKNPLLTVTKFEFIRQIKKPSFWATILLIPAMVIVMFMISMFAGGKANEPTLDENTRITITDEANVLPKENPMVAKISKEEGKKKVINDETDLYFYIPADFKDTKKVGLYHISEGLDIFNTDGQVIKVVLKQALSSKFSDVEVAALTGNFEVTDNKLTKTGEESNALGKAIIPGVILVLFFFFVTLFGGRLLMTVVEEKENRISEMILTSVSAKHLIVGKILSMMMLGVIQILALIIPLIVALIIYKDNPMVSQILSTIEINPITIIENIALFIFSSLLATGFLTYIGAITPTAKDASQFIGPVIIGVVFPLYFMSSFMAAEPNGLVYFLTYFPLSAPTAMMLRSVFGTLSTPELIVGIVEIIVLSFIVIRLTVRTFQKNAINFSLALPSFFKIKK